VYISIMATMAKNRNVVVVGIECASNSYGWLLATGIQRLR
jgi:hypothetical protein